MRNLFRYIVISTFFWQMCYCDTNVYITNNTPMTLRTKLNFAGEATLKLGDDFFVNNNLTKMQREGIVLRPWSRQVVLKVNRNLPGTYNRFLFQQAVSIDKGGTGRPVFLTQKFRIGSVFDAHATMHEGVVFQGSELTNLQKALPMITTSNKTGKAEDRAEAKEKEFEKILKPGFFTNLGWRTNDGRPVDLNCDEMLFIGDMHADIEYAFSVRPHTTAKFDTNKDRFYIVTHNVYMRPRLGFPHDGQSTRAAKIPNEIKGWDKNWRPDVIAYNETFDNPSEAVLKKALEKEGYRYYTSVLGRTSGSSKNTTGKDTSSKFFNINGGVFVASKWPITTYEGLEFKGMCVDEDCMSAKGVLYAMINKKGKRYHVFASHTQADTGDAKSIRKCKAARAKQFKVIRNFIDQMKKKHNITKDEPIFIAGDLNVMQKDKAEYDFMLKTLRAVNTKNKGFKYTNEIDNVVFDYILYDKDQAQPRKSYLKHLQVRFQKPWSTGGPSDKESMRYWPSDHCPVFGFFNYRVIPEEKELEKKIATNKKEIKQKNQSKEEAKKLKKKTEEQKKQTEEKLKAIQKTKKTRESAIKRIEISAKGPTKATIKAKKEVVELGQKIENEKQQIKLLVKKIKTEQEKINKTTKEIADLKSKTIILQKKLEKAREEW